MNHVPDPVDLDPRIVGFLEEVRGRLRAVVIRLLPEDHGARSLARFLGVDRMTGWRCWTLVHEPDPRRAVRAMPGRRGWDRILTGLQTGGATGAELAAIRREVRAFEVFLGEQDLDWTLLVQAEREKASNRTQDAATEIIESRRLASEGAMGLYGLKSRLMLVSYIVAPGASAGMVSLGSFGLIDGLQRTREGDAWPIVQRPVIEESGKTRSLHRPCGDSSEIPGLMTTISTPGIDQGTLFRQHLGERTEMVMFAGGMNEQDPGKAGFRVGFGECMLDRSFGSSESAEAFHEVQLVTSFLTPSRLAVIELLVHRDLEVEADPTVTLIGTPLGPENLSERRHARLLPLEAECRPGTPSPLPKRFGPVGRARTEGLRRVCEPMGCRSSDCATFRLELPHPPLFASVGVSFGLRTRGR
jgi:hypothetical protein